MRVKLTKAQKIRVLNTKDLYKVMQDILLRENKIGRDKEHCWVVCLSSTYRILLIELISLGTANSTVVNATEIFSFALQKRASYVILVHNHPGGALLPSPQDMDITNRMYHAGLFLEVPMIDHLIISETQCLSFEEMGFLAKIAKSKKYVMQFKREEERIKREGEKAGVLKKAMQMAKILKKKGVDVQLIAVASGLSIAKIKKL
jgi:DNA repair protein RadC